jgi:DNA gyrase/topoisomerase IV subunit B
VSALCKGLKVRVTFNGEEKTFHNKHGIIDALDFFKERNSKKNTEYLGKPFQFEADSIQCAIQWSNLPGEDNVANYVNFASTPDVQSTSVKGAFDVIGRVFKKVKVKGADFTVADLREGMVLVLHYMCNNARYAGQNKEKLNTVEAVEDVKRLLEQPLTKWVKENEKLVRKIIKRASDIRKARAEAKKITQAASSLKASKKNLAGSDKLRMCSKKCPAAERELILAEGDSAGGALFLARNNYNQIILSLRGKPLNVMKTKSVAQDLKNKEIQDILIAIGADPKKIAKGEHLTEVAVGKILLATDADIDGPLEANTKVWMLDGTKPTIKELAQRWEKNPEPFWVLSRNNKGELVPAQAIAPRITTTTDEYIKVTFDNGLVKRVTGNHKWVVNKAKKSEFVSEENGNNYIRTKHLSVGDSINSFYAISSAADGSPRKEGTPTWDYMIKRKVSPEKDFQKWVDSCLEKTNHKVVKLEKVVSKKERNFYCLTVPEHGNFFIDDGDGNGICSGNCHIRTLINCILYKYVRAVFAANMVYILKMPLFQAAWTEKGEEVRSYGDTLEEAMKGAPKRAIVTRFKGLGEMTAEQMQPYAHSDSKLRKLVPITEIEAKKDHDEYMRLTGENTDYRKKMFNIQ